VIKNVLNTNKFRYERKFVISYLSLFELESIVRLHPAMFLEVFPQRFVNNIYLDSFGKESYVDNVNGASQRSKVRIRWYGDLFKNIQTPVLEFKSKNNLLGTKTSFVLSDFSLDKKFSRKILRNVFFSSDLPLVVLQQLSLLDLSLLNRYSRRYFQSADCKFRITLDFDMEFYKLLPVRNTFLCRSDNKMDTILELKYAENLEEEVDCITRYLPFRITKSSKYISGLDSLNF
jgi:hypothetical protein